LETILAEKQNQIDKLKLSPKKIFEKYRQNISE
jgi:hypothetical protein